MGKASNDVFPRRGMAGCIFVRYRELTSRRDVI